MDFILFILAILIGIVALAMGFRGLARKAPVEPEYDDETQDEKVDRYDRGYNRTSVRDQNRARKAAWEKEIQELREYRTGSFIWAIGGLLIAAVLFTLSVTYTQSNGQVAYITRIGGEVIKADATMGMGTKAPWDSATKWDLFTRDISLSEPSSDFESEFEAGEITASRVATAVKTGAAELPKDSKAESSEEDSGAQVWYDLDATYNLVREGETIEEQEERLLKLFKTYRSQDRFTRQEIFPALLQAANKVPSEYTTTEFRGAGSVDAAQKIAERVSNELSDVGVAITTATISDVDFTKAVEASLSKVEEKQQLAKEAAAEADAKDVTNAQLIDDANARASANEIESNSITPELLAKWKIEAMKDGTLFVTNDDSDVILSVPGGNTPR